MFLFLCPKPRIPYFCRKPRKRQTKIACLPCFRDILTLRLLLFKNVVEEFQIVERRFVLAFFDTADYFDRPVVDGSRHADLSSVLAHNAVDCLDLARFALSISCNILARIRRCFLIATGIIANEIFCLIGLL